jgi:hypothetical protein
MLDELARVLDERLLIQRRMQTEERVRRHLPGRDAVRRAVAAEPRQTAAVFLAIDTRKQGDPGWIELHQLGDPLAGRAEALDGLGDNRANIVESLGRDAKSGR